jgi:hypothetical protein
VKTVFASTYLGLRAQWPDAVGIRPTASGYTATIYTN